MILGSPGNPNGFFDPLLAARRMTMTKTLSDIFDGGLAIAGIG